MKKVLLRSSMYLTIFSFALMLVQCNKNDEGTKYYKVEGTVTLSEGINADGAVVSLSTSPNGANIIAKTITDSDGMYTFISVESGTYYVNAMYDPNNSNNMLKSAGNVSLSGVEVEVDVQNDATANIEMAGAVSSGNLSFDLANWNYDGTHSAIDFEFPYDAINALFKGHFAHTGFDELKIDDANLASSKIKAWVDLASIETGAPSLPGGHGRDGLTGCIAGTFQIKKDPADTVTVYASDGTEITNWPNETLENYDLWGDGSTTTYQKQSSIEGSSGVATFESTEITPFGTGYAAKGTFTFAGVSKEVMLYFNYLEGYSKENNSSQLVNYVSFFGTFKFEAYKDFGIDSGHLGDATVTVNISAQFNSNPA